MSAATRDGTSRVDLPGLLRMLRRWRDAARHDPARRAAALRRVEKLAWLLDSAMSIPGLQRRIGLDAILGAVPVVGDAVGAVLAGWIVVEAWRIGAPARLLGRMAANIAIDTGLGAVPIAGDVFDVFSSSNRRNAELLRSWLSGRG